MRVIGETTGENDRDHVHAATGSAGVTAGQAVACGVPAGVARAAVADLDAVPVGDRLRPVLRYVGKLTRTPAEMTQQDVAGVLAAGWDEAALHHAVLVCALFNFMNRVVDGLGVRSDESYFQLSGQRLVDVGYSGLGALLD